MTLYRTLAGVGLALALAACSNPSTTTLTEAAICSSAGNVLKQLAPFRAAGKLTQGTVAAVNSASATLDPVCSSPTAPSATSAASAALVAAAGQLSGILTAMEAK